MHGIDHKDGDRKIDWSNAAKDYAAHRPGYPPSFYQRLKRYNIGTPGQKILDLATGTGTLARTFAASGAEVVGVDIAEGQIESAKQLAANQNLKIDFHIASAEKSGLPDNSFDVISASQSWLYFDKVKMIPEIYRLLKPGGRLLTCHLCWLPRIDAIARESEALILKHNPDWSAGDWSGETEYLPPWAAGKLQLEGMFYYDEELTFTQESWRGRIRASRGIAATLTTEEVQAFDREHEAALKRQLKSDSFAVLHRIDAHIFHPC
jgi:SAM-dependent methyltransferase